MLFVGVFLVEGLVRPGYDPLRHQVSDLSLGDPGWIQVVCFDVTGLAIIGIAVSLRRILDGGRAALGAPLALMAAGTRPMVAGASSADPSATPYLPAVAGLLQRVSNAAFALSSSSAGS